MSKFGDGTKPSTSDVYLSCDACEANGGRVLLIGKGEGATKERVRVMRLLPEVDSSAARGGAEAHY